MRVETAARLSPQGLEKLMHISPKLGALNAQRFRAFPDGQGAKPAVEMFSGDTYVGLEARSLDPDELAYAQDHLRILSGLYGLLRPLDLIQPHRLEMGSRLTNPRGRNLYEFWGDRIALALAEQAAQLGSKTLLNCASGEYFKAANRPALGLRVITPVFMEDTEKGPKIISFYAKQARGAMARFVMQKRVRDPEGLKDFDAGGYRFQPERSSGEQLVFLRSA
ncbi:MAG TPA: peroxide stress protein YaaA [Aliiroseovarius sp.]|nr:peroxide stress protein YaaA [Aliiroseovarius sp.]